ncbi:hypothetical protein QBC44DRAFT_41403 [Cladorrhinum sp. PSN332]|nr:hypothetical protein QBC44DRAFT_41403 [Cladorrhinum sp. PSN332]
MDPPPSYPRGPSTSGNNNIPTLPFRPLPSESTSTSTSSSKSSRLPTLPILPSSSSSSTTKHKFSMPTKRINSGSDIQFFHTTKAYRDIMTFIVQLNRSVCPRFVVVEGGGGGGNSKRIKFFPLVEEEEESREKQQEMYPESVERIRNMLRKVEGIIDEVPAEEYADRRYGNRAFRVFWARLQEGGVDVDLLAGLGLQDGKEIKDDGGGVSAKEELGVYLMGSWGSAERLDYGTGHELSFLAFLGGLWKLGFFGEGGEETERAVVLGVVEMYLKVVRKLILTYSLEPAGSHGVWGLDDHSFLPYIFGSAQFTRPIQGDEPMPLEGSAPGVPKPSEVVKPASVQNWRRENMYFSAIGFIYDVKKGPFWEHSPTLYDISGIQHGWGKINKGMIKMYDAEVLGKFPVVQHFPFGSLWEWEQVPGMRVGQQNVHVASQPAPAVGAGSGTAMPPPMGVPTARMPPPPMTAFPMTGGRLRNHGGDGVEDLLPGDLTKGRPGTASHQFSITKAPWVRD